MRLDEFNKILLGLDHIDKESLEQYVQRVLRAIAPHEDVPETVVELWDAIHIHADVSNELGAQGNSGEFHSDSAEREILRELDKTLTVLCEKFAAITGYMPEWIEVEQMLYFRGHQTYIDGAWKLNKI